MSTTIDILWTGGWDSTFRVLQLLHSGATVVPHYVMDRERPSTAYELRACDRIQFELPRAWGDRLRPLKVVTRDTIAPYPDVSAAFERLRARHWMGDQYDWLARYCRQHEVTVELAIHRDDKAHDAIESSVCGDRLAEHATADEAYVFGRFRLPVFELSKLDMKRQAEAMGFANLMRHTWFCHTPWRGKPCGVCNPCRYTIEEGLGFRVSRWGHIRRRIPMIARARKIIGA